MQKIHCTQCGRKSRLPDNGWPYHCSCGVTWTDETHWRSRGLGDTIAKLTSAVGIHPCGGCKKRQAQLNALVSYRADLGRSIEAAPVTSSSAGLSQAARDIRDTDCLSATEGHHLHAEVTQ